MTVPEVMRLTWALRQPDTVLAAAEALRGVPDLAAIEGLVEQLLATPAARPALAAVDALATSSAPLVLDALIRSLDSPFPSVRLAAVTAIRERRVADAALLRRLQTDGSWVVRRAALEALADRPDDDSIFAAADDPHWRVRHALIRVLLARGTDEQRRQEIDRRLAGHGPVPAVEGVRAYLRWRWTGRVPEKVPTPADPMKACPFWDWDAAVLARTIERFDQHERRRALDTMPWLLRHPEERVRTPVVEVLRDVGEARHLAGAVALLDEPRLGVGDSLKKLLESLDLDQTEAAARFILHLPVASPSQLAWAVDQAGPAFPCDEERERLAELLARGHPDEVVRTALARLASRWHGGDEQPSATDSPSYPSGHPYIRAAALTPTTAADLIRDPWRETSWHVLAQAARLTKTPLWRLEPQPPWRPEPPIPSTPAPLSPRLASPIHERKLGPEELTVAPLGVSGHYGLPVEGFVRAVEAGVNLLFWEPNYQTLTDFMTRLPPSDRNAVHVIAGTFEADGRRIRSDAERALRSMRIDRLSVFLLFWTQSWRRITPEITETLEGLKRSGKVLTASLSTHDRTLALEAMDRGWNPIMVRHSAAHRGAEQQVFPHAVRTGTSLITFNNTCYGRLLKPVGELPAPSAADCYRYCLMQAGVRACLSAPANLEQLDENLKALRDPTLPEDRLRALLAHGEALYREETVFRKLVRVL